MTDKLLVLAAGISSRMRKPASGTTQLESKLASEADLLPKAMLSVGTEGKPFLFYLLYNAKQAGIRNVTLVVGANDHYFREKFGSRDRDNDFNGLKISYARQLIPEGRTKPWGTADAVYQGMLARPDWRGSKFICVNSDNIYSPVSLNRLSQCDDANAFLDYDIAGFQFKESRVSSFGVTHKDQDGYLIEIIEKPSEAEAQKYAGPDGAIRVSMNLWLFDYDMVFPYLESCPVHPKRNEKELPDAITNMIKDHPGAMKAIPWSEHIPDLTAKDDIVPTMNYLKEHFAAMTW